MIEGGEMGEERDGGKWAERGERLVCHFDKYTCLLEYHEPTGHRTVIVNTLGRFALVLVNKWHLYRVTFE